VLRLPYFFFIDGPSSSLDLGLFEVLNEMSKSEFLVNGPVMSPEWWLR